MLLLSSTTALPTALTIDSFVAPGVVILVVVGIAIAFSYRGSGIASHRRGGRSSADAPGAVGKSDPGGHDQDQERPFDEHGTK